MDAGNSRLRLKQVEVIEENKDACRVRVTLTGKDKIFVGELAGESDEQSRYALAAQATLAAIAQALVKKITFDLKGININEVFEGLSESLLVVVVGVNDGSSETVMPGSCRNSGDNIEAVVKATLDATNRVVEVHMV